MSVAPAPEDAALPVVGQILSSKYRVERCIGRGGMGAVYQARHEVLGHTVAIKFLLPKVAQSEAAAARFVNEARAAAQIGNEHVARVLDVELLPDHSAFMVLEYLVGSDLNAGLATGGPMPVAVVAGYALQALEGIAAAHAMGIVHRDLKPANLFLTRRPDGTSFVKVLDFGISKPADPVFSVTTSHSLVGSPSYMSPEQVRSSKAVDLRSDIWSTGVCLYQLSTGELPFHGDNVGEVLAAILEAEPVPPSRLRPGIPAEFDAVVARCLVRDREQRFQDAAALAEALAPFVPEAERAAVGRIRNILSGTAPVAPPVAPVIGAHTPTPGPAAPSPSFVRKPEDVAVPVSPAAGGPEITAASPSVSEATAAPPSAAPPPPPAPPSPAVPPLAATYLRPGAPQGSVPVPVPEPEPEVIPLRSRAPWLRIAMAVAAASVAAGGYVLWSAQSEPEVPTLVQAPLLPATQPPAQAVENLPPPPPPPADAPAIAPQPTVEKPAARPAPATGKEPAPRTPSAAPTTPAPDPTPRAVEAPARVAIQPPPTPLGVLTLSTTPAATLRMGGRTVDGRGIVLTGESGTIEVVSEGAPLRVQLAYGKDGLEVRSEPQALVWLDHIAKGRTPRLLPWGEGMMDVELKSPRVEGEVRIVARFTRR